MAPERRHTGLHADGAVIQVLQRQSDCLDFTGAMVLGGELEQMGRWGVATCLTWWKGQTLTQGGPHHPVRQQSQG